MSSVSGNFISVVIEFTLKSKYSSVLLCKDLVKSRDSTWSHGTCAHAWAWVHDVTLLTCVSCSLS